MTGIIENFLTKHCIICKVGFKQGGSSYYALFRILTGFLFFQHGIQKLFGFWGGIDGAGSPVDMFSLVGAAGLIEFSVGIALILGFFTRLAAILGAVEMIIAYFMVHAPLDPSPLLNKGELVLLYVASFLAMIRYGAGRWSIEKAVIKREIF